MLEYFKNKYPSIQEIRIRCGKSVMVISNNMECLENTVADREYIESFISFLTSNSVYAYKEEISEGYITIEGGNRAGICGKAVIKNGNVEHIKEVSSINIRFAREFKGCADKVWNKIKNPLKNTVFVSPPGCGKTTMLRDVAREASYYGKNVCIVDERCEIAPLNNRICPFDLGPRCDIMSGMPKSKGINMVLRTMNPDVIVVDEIGSKEDSEAIYNALNSGVKIITSFHAYNIEEFKRRFNDFGIFECIVTLCKENGVGEVKDVVCLN